jgi:hypothetical protein
MRSPVAAVAALAAATLVTTGCAGPAYAELTFNATEGVKVTEVVIGEGSGDVVVRTSARTDTAISRVVRYRGAQPKTAYRLTGGSLAVDTDCGDNCSVSYTIDSPPGVTVRGATRSGDIALTDIAAADVRAGSGDITVRNATGAVTARTSSGSIRLSDVKGTVTATAESGDVEALGLGGTTDAQAGSGDVNLDFATGATGGAATTVGVKARTTSGDITVAVPADSPFTISAATGSGDENIGVTSVPNAPNRLDLQAGSGDIFVHTR